MLYLGFFSQVSYCVEDLLAVRLDGVGVPAVGQLGQGGGLGEPGQELGEVGAVAQNDESPGLHAGSRGGFDGQADEPVHGILADGCVRVLTDAAPVFYGFSDVKHDFFLL